MGRGFSAFSHGTQRSENFQALLHCCCIIDSRTQHTRLSLRHNMEDCCIIPHVLTDPTCNSRLAPLHLALKQILPRKTASSCILTEFPTRCPSRSELSTLRKSFQQCHHLGTRIFSNHEANVLVRASQQGSHDGCESYVVFVAS